jgi:hypothetical protein
MASLILFMKLRAQVAKDFTARERSDEEVLEFRTDLGDCRISLFAAKRHKRRKKNLKQVTHSGENAQTLGVLFCAFCAFLRLIKMD